MIFQSLFPRDIFEEMDRWQRELQQGFDANIRGTARGAYPALNVGGTPESVEIYAFAPGLDPARIEITLDRGTLSISGERAGGVAGRDEGPVVHIRERFTGRFRRVVSLPDDIDPNAVSAAYRDGVLHVSIKRLAATQPRRISIG
ncbi:MAG: Hsp20/alpha crystallin family protein [Gammaproteobacteria bacterium]